MLRRLCLVLLPLLFATGSSWAENQSLKLDGKGSYVELPPNLFTNLDRATVEVWVKWEALQKYSRVFEFGAAWQSMSLFNHDTSPDLRFNLHPEYAKDDEALRHVIVARDLIRTNEWIHLAAVSGPGGMLLYANGHLVGQHANTASFASIPVFRANYLGRGFSGAATDQDFEGEIDELRVWNQRRTIAQIRASMFKRHSGREEGLVHLWNFDDGTANDACSEAGHGKMMGHARVVPSDLGLVTEIITASASVPTPPVRVLPPVPPTNAGSPNAAAWWIAGALTFLAALLTWLTLMLRRSGVGTHKILVPSPPVQLPAALPPPPSLGASDHQQLKERALSELTSFAKESLVQGLFSQRAALLEAQKQAHRELAELEGRLANLRLPDRIKAYERRIAELEMEKETRGDEVRQLTRATLSLLRTKLEQERQRVAATTRFN